MSLPKFIPVLSILLSLFSPITWGSEPGNHAPPLMQSQTGFEKSQVADFNPELRASGLNPFPGMPNFEKKKSLPAKIPIKRLSKEAWPPVVLDFTQPQKQPLSAKLKRDKLKKDEIKELKQEIQKVKREILKEIEEATAKRVPSPIQKIEKRFDPQPSKEILKEKEITFWNIPKRVEKEKEVEKFNRSIAATSAPEIAVPVVPEVSIILSHRRFHPPKLKLKSGMKTRLIFATLNKRPAALVIEKLRIQRWLAKEGNPNQYVYPAPWELNKEISQNRLTEVTVTPKQGTYVFQDIITGARGEIIVE